MVAHKIRCIPDVRQKYKLDKQKKERMFQTDLRPVNQLKSLTADMDKNTIFEQIGQTGDKRDSGNLLADKFSYEPIICNINERTMNEQDMAKARRAEDRRQKRELKDRKNTLDYYAADQDDGDSLAPIQEKPLNYAKMGVYKEKRVSLSHDQLLKNLFELFRQNKEYKLNDLVDILNHPVQPLKKTLQDVADYDTRKKVYTLKTSLKF